MHPSGDWLVSTAQAGVTGAGTNQADISTRAPPTTERYWFTTPGHPTSEVEPNGSSALPVWQSDCTCIVWLPPHVLVKVGRHNHGSISSVVQTSNHRIKTTHDSTPVFLDVVQKTAKRNTWRTAYGLVPDYSVRRTSGGSICGPKFITWPGTAW